MAEYRVPVWMMVGCAGLAAYLVICQPGLGHRDSVAVKESPRGADAQQALAAAMVEPDFNPYAAERHLDRPISWVLKPRGWERFDEPLSEGRVGLVWDRWRGSVRLWDGHRWKLFVESATQVTFVNDLSDGRSRQVSEVLIEPGRGLDQAAELTFVLPSMDGFGRVVWPEH